MVSLKSEGGSDIEEEIKETNFLHSDNNDNDSDKGDNLSDYEIESSSNDRPIASHVPRARGPGQGTISRYYFAIL